MKLLFWLDFETEGLDPIKNKPLSIAMGITDIYGRTVEPTKLLYLNFGPYQCEPKALEVHGLTKEIIEDKGISLNEFVKELEGYFQEYTDLIPAGQNIMNFDMVILNHILKDQPSLRFKISRRYIDLQQFSLFYFPFENPKFSEALKRFNLNQSIVHNALEDVENSIKLYKEYRKLLTFKSVLKRSLKGFFKSIFFP